MRCNILALLLFAPLVAAEGDIFNRLCTKIINKNQAASFIVNADSMSDMYDQVCTNESYALTVLNCINTAASLLPENGMSKSHAIKFSWTYYGYICDYYNKKLVFKRDELQEKLKENPITQTYAEANSTKTLPFTVPVSKLEPNMKAAKEFYVNRRMSDVYGQATLYYVFGVIGLQIVFNFLSWVVPKAAASVADNKPMKLLRSYFTMPPLLKEKQARALRFYGERMHIFLIAGYFAVNYILMSVRIGTTLSPYFYQEKSVLVGSFLAYRSGYLCMYKLPLVFLFAGRNNILIWLTGWDMSVFNTWHRWLSRFATIDAMIHTIAFHIHMVGYLAESWRESYWICGAVAVFAWMIMCLQGWKYARALAYDVFVLGHILLAIASVVTLFYHLRYTHQCLELWYTLVAIWLFDRVMRLVRIKMAGTSDALALEVTEDCLVIYVKQQRTAWKPYSGAYVFVHFLDPLYFWQSHPFTVVDTDGEGRIKLICKVRRGVTRHILRKVRSYNGEPYPLKMWVEGPYGVARNFASFDEVSCVAGGVGITAVYSHLKKRVHGTCEQPTTVHWVIPDQRPLIWFHEEINRMKQAGIQLIVYLTRETALGASVSEEDLSLPAANNCEVEPSCCNAPAPVVTEKGCCSGEVPVATTKGGPASVSSEGSMEKKDGLTRSDWSFQPKPNVNDIVANTIRESQGSVVFFACGPQSMNLEVREAVAAHLSDSQNYVQYFEESFGM